MRKLMCFVLALALVMSLSAVAGAETGVGQGSYTAEVTGQYVEGTTTSATVYSVDIAWDSMEFVYHAAKAAQWNPTSHKYENETKAYWDGQGTVTVTNHSNVEITATPVFAQEEGYPDVNLTFAPAELKLKSAAETETAVHGEITVTPNGTLPVISNENQNKAKIGTITVIITGNSAFTVDTARSKLAEARALYDSLGENIDQTRKLELNKAITDLSEWIDGYDDLEENSLWGTADYQTRDEYLNEMKTGYYDVLVYFMTQVQA